MSLCLFRLFWSDYQPKSNSSFSMLHNLVAPVMIRAASVCTESSCFLVSTDRCPILNHSTLIVVEQKICTSFPMICDLL